MNERGFILWFTGLSGAGKSTLAERVGTRLKELGQQVEILDGDEVRENLSQGLGFSKQDRDTNIRRIGFVANLLARNGVVAITAAISPEQRDTKGLYAKARAGTVKLLTGVSDPYEEPLKPELQLKTGEEPVAASVERIFLYLRGRGLVS